MLARNRTIVNHGERFLRLDGDITTLNRPIPRGKVKQLFVAKQESHFSKQSNLWTKSNELGPWWALSAAK